jgi:hypothetical protein
MIRCDPGGALIEDSLAAASLVELIDSGDLVVAFYVTCTGKCLDALEVRDRERLCIAYDRTSGGDRAIVF